MSAISYRQTDFETVKSQFESVLEFSRKAFLKNHEITKAAFDATSPRFRHEFDYLFKECVADMLYETRNQKGYFFIAENEKTHEIVGISLGRSYGKPILSQKFIDSARAARSKFIDTLKDWSKLMGKYQLDKDDFPPHLVYHQAMTAVDPKYARQGIGTELSKLVMTTIAEAGYVALARENSSTSSHGVMRKLKSLEIEIVEIDSVENEATKMLTTLRLQLVKTAMDKATEVARWFLNRKKLSVTLSEHFTLSNLQGIQAVFQALENLEMLLKMAETDSIANAIQRKIDELNAVIDKEINTPVSQGETPIFIAARADDIKTLKHLFGRRADLFFAEPVHGDSILHVAIKNQSASCVREILQNAPRLATTPNESGIRPLELVKELSSSRGDDFKKVVEELKKHLPSS